MSEIGQGLTLSGIGILITFSALGILILLILVLKILFPVKKDQPLTSLPDQDRESGKDPEREHLLKRAAGTGVAVLMGMKSSPGNGSLGSVLEKPVGQWWQRGLDRIHGKE